VSLLQRSVPELQGVSSVGINRFLEAAGKSKNEFHSFMFLRHGKVIAEGWWNPYSRNLKHSMYSVSKSFTSTAIGFAVSEKLLRVDDKVISFFPEDLPDTLSAYLSELRVKDLLTMSVGQEPDPTGKVVTTDSNWIKAFLSLPIIHQPGTKFLYNTLATYMLSAIVQKVTGQRVIDYLKPRLFVPLQIQGVDWEVDPRGINTGGWGLRIKTEDMAKFGQLYLNKGNWNGKQILPRAWVEEATTIKIEQQPDFAQAKKDSSDWLQGYCYKFWRCRHNAFRADGAYGQFIVIMPDQDAVIVITSETADMQDELNLVWQYLLPAMKDSNPETKKMQTELRQTLYGLALPLPAKKMDTTLLKNISGRKFWLDTNEKNILTITFLAKDKICHFILKTDTAAFDLAFGSGKWVSGVTTRRGPYLLAKAKACYVGLPPLKVAGSYSWKNENTLELILRYIESPHSERFVCRFEQNKISVDMSNSFDYVTKQITLKGTSSKSTLTSFISRERIFTSY
jgi:hypothetical protein